jgi:hypothetical protein
MKKPHINLCIHAAIVTIAQVSPGTCNLISTTAGPTCTLPRTQSQPTTSKANSILGWIWRSMEQ